MLSGLIGTRNIFKKWWFDYFKISVFFTLDVISNFQHVLKPLNILYRLDYAKKYSLAFSFSKIKVNKAKFTRATDMSSCFSYSVLQYYVLCDFSIKSVKAEIET